MYLPGADRLRAARSILEDDDCDRVSLERAAGEFWAATFDSEDWPVELRVKSLTARFGLARHGSPERTIPKLDDAELRRLCRELVEVADLADRLTSQSAG